MAVNKKFSQPTSKKIAMNEKIPKKSAKELFIVGIASASVFLSGSALALGTTNKSNSNQSFNNPTSLADSSVRSKEVLAQTAPEDNKPPAPGDVSPRENPPPAPDGSSEQRPSSSGSGGTGTPQPSDAKPRGSEPPTTGTSPTDTPRDRNASGPPPQPGTWLCINNPNPKCRG